MRIAKKQRGKYRGLGIPCLRDRVAQTAALLVLSPSPHPATRPGNPPGDARIEPLATSAVHPDDAGHGGEA